jgi:hypothetical protein
MNDCSRRNLLRATAGAAVVVPMVAISSSVANAADRTGLSGGRAASENTITAQHPVLFCVHDAARGEVSILHGENEVVVVDKRLVARILQAAATTSIKSVTSASSSLA